MGWSNPTGSTQTFYSKYSPCPDLFLYFLYYDAADTKPPRFTELSSLSFSLVKHVACANIMLISDMRTRMYRFFSDLFNFIDLHALVNAPWFRGDDVQSGPTLRNNREQLGLMPLYTLNVPNKKKHLDSSGKLLLGTSEYVCHSLVDVVVHLASQPDVMENLVCEARTGSNVKEQWHGRVFRECPLYTSDRLRTDGGVYDLGSTLIDQSRRIWLLSGIARDEQTNRWCCYLRRYQSIGSARHDNKTIRELALTEDERKISADAMDSECFQRVSIHHIPHLGAPAGLTLFLSLSLSHTHTHAHTHTHTL
jgi:hypothetical protein